MVGVGRKHEKLHHWVGGVLLKGYWNSFSFSFGFWVTMDEPSLPPTLYHHVLSHTGPNAMGSTDQTL